jgi:hypothetical protein
LPVRGRCALYRRTSALKRELVGTANATVGLELLSPLRQQEAQPPTERELDALQDNEIDALYHSSLRALADSYRRPRVLA